MRRDPARGLGTLAVVVAHPDDEVIGVGGQLLRWAPAWAVNIIIVTDGAPPGLCDAVTAGFATRDAYAAARRAEHAAALACPPAPPVSLVRLEMGDQCVTRELETAIRRLARVLTALAPDIVVTHAYEGGHPDHDAVAFAVHTLRREALAAAFRHLEFAGYHENAGGGLTTNRFAEPVTAEAIRIRLTPEERRVKQRMLACFRSQQVTLAPFLTREEWVRVAPPCDFSQPPNGGRVWYEHFGWGGRSADWRARVAEVDARGAWRSRCRAS